jgi:hypothetical protein
VGGRLRGAVAAKPEASRFGESGGVGVGVGGEPAFDRVDQFEVQLQEPSHEAADQPKVLLAVRELLGVSLE